MRTSSAGVSRHHSLGLRSRKRQDMLFCLCLLLPALVLCAAFILIPIVDSVAMSFTSYKLVNLTKNRPGEWNDFANYTRLWKAGKLQSAIGITGWFVFCTVTLTFLISMTLALILNTEPKGARFLRSVMMIPWVIPTVITGLLWAWIYANPYGLVQYLVNLFSGGKITEFGMLNGKGTALWGVTIAGLWKQVPLMTLLLLAGMQNVPEDILEAAKIDGAGYFTRLIHILIPYMRSVIAVSVSMCIIENFKQYPLFATLTNGGPVGATTTLAVLSYDEAFVNNNYGSGAAVTTVFQDIPASKRSEYIGFSGDIDLRVPCRYSKRPIQLCNGHQSVQQCGEYPDPADGKLCGQKSNGYRAVLREEEMGMDTAMKRQKIKTRKASLFDVINISLLLLLTFICFYPLYFTVIASFSDYVPVATGQVNLVPIGFQTTAYRAVFENQEIWRGYLNTILYTVFGTAFNLLLTIPTAYVMSKKKMFGHKVITWYFLITMYFHGGMAATYLLYKDLNLINNPLVMVVTGGLSIYNMIVTRTYFTNSIPDSLYEAGRIDGSSEFGLFFRIALPLSGPILAVMALYYAVGHWNSYWNAMMYLSNRAYHPLSLVLRRILILNESALSEDQLGMLDPETIADMARRANLAVVMKYALVLISSAPMLIAYPFVQKYFVKGMMIGSVKG